MRRFLKVAAVALATLALVGFALFRHFDTEAARPVAAPYPAIRPDTSAAGIARGELLFRPTCMSCHKKVGAPRVSGAKVDDLPAAFGEIYSHNLTSHPTAGIGRVPDAVIARTVRYGVMPDGRVSIMPSFAMSDADLAAVLGFLRSASPILAPDPTVQPPSRLTQLGRLMFYVSHGMGKAPDLPAQGLTAPPARPDAAYGEYLARDVLGCGECHTPGFNAGKAHGDEAFSGGFAFTGPDGKPIHSANITPDGTGLYLWTYADFVRAIRDGLRPDGAPVRSPMPRYRLPGRELRALWAFLKTVPRRISHSPDQPPVDFSRRPHAEGEAVAASTEGFNAGSTPPAAPPTGAQIFVQLGCPVCHAEGALYHEQFKKARTRKADFLVQWIRHPELVKPETPMPSFASQLSEERAHVLAEWILKTPPDRLPKMGGGG